jgi:hypothetical protein
MRLYKATTADEPASLPGERHLGPVWGTLSGTGRLEACLTDAAAVKTSPSFAVVPVGAYAVKAILALLRGAIPKEKRSAGGGILPGIKRLNSVFKALTDSSERAGATATPHSRRKGELVKMTINGKHITSASQLSR